MLARLHASPPTQGPPPPCQRELRRAHQAEFVVCDQTIERLWARLKEWRAVATRYEKTAASFSGILCLAAALDHLR
ncbi:transposase [Methylobacterium sp. P31]